MICIVPIIIIMWIVAVVNLFLGGSLDQYGVKPRTGGSGFAAIAYGPLIHASLGHVIGNTLPFYGLGSFVLMIRDRRIFVGVTLTIWFLSGLLVWTFGRSETSHVGISGVVFGYFGFVLTVALVEKRCWSLIIATVAFILYGSTMLGFGFENLLPFGNPDVSFEGHLAGLLVGIASAFVLVTIVETRCRSSRSESYKHDVDAKDPERKPLVGGDDV